MLRSVAGMLLASSALLTSSALLIGCGAPELGELDDQQSGTAIAEIVSVPSDVQCVRIVVEGKRTVTQDTTVRPSTSVKIVLDRLPVGPAVFSGFAFADTCEDVAKMSPPPVPTWVTDTSKVDLKAGATANVPMTFKHNAAAEINATFEDDGTSKPKLLVDPFDGPAFASAWSRVAVEAASTGVSFVGGVAEIRDTDPVNGPAYFDLSGGWLNDQAPVRGTPNPRQAFISGDSSYSLRFRPGLASDMSWGEMTMNLSPNAGTRGTVYAWVGLFADLRLACETEVDNLYAARNLPRTGNEYTLTLQFTQSTGAVKTVLRDEGTGDSIDCSNTTSLAAPYGFTLHFGADGAANGSGGPLATFVDFTSNVVLP